MIRWVGGPEWLPDVQYVGVVEITPPSQERSHQAMLLDTGDGHVIAIVVVVGSPDEWDRDMAMAEPVIQSFDFSP